MSDKLISQKERMVKKWKTMKIQSVNPAIAAIPPIFKIAGFASFSMEKEMPVAINPAQKSE